MFMKWYTIELVKPNLTLCNNKENPTPDTRSTPVMTVTLVDFLLLLI